MKAIKSIFAFLFIAAIPMLSLTACGDDEPAANTWTVVKNGKTYSYQGNRIKISGIFRD